MGMFAGSDRFAWVVIRDGDQGRARLGQGRGVSHSQFTLTGCDRFAWVVIRAGDWREADRWPLAPRQRLHPHSGSSSALLLSSPELSDTKVYGP